AVHVEEVEAAVEVRLVAAGLAGGGGGNGGGQGAGLGVESGVAELRDDGGGLVGHGVLLPCRRGCPPVRGRARIGEVRRVRGARGRPSCRGAAGRTAGRAGRGAGSGRPRGGRGGSASWWGPCQRGSGSESQDAAEGVVLPLVNGADVAEHDRRTFLPAPEPAD